jgi:predicted acetyltransferase
VACVRIRLRLTPDLEREGGHIGYDVRPSRRREGLGTTLLRLALVEARTMGIARVLITCDADNVGSQKIIERNGGQYAGSSAASDSGKVVLQYWISG